MAAIAVGNNFKGQGIWAGCPPRLTHNEPYGKAKAITESPAEVS